MTSIDFYFNAEDRLQVACRLAAKAVKQKSRLLIYAPDAEIATRIDRLLWTAPAIGFVPHVPARSPLAAETPVLIGAPGDAPATCEVLLNLGADCPPQFERFARLLEVVSAEASDKEAGRGRFRFYRERGYKIASHDLAGASHE